MRSIDRTLGDMELAINTTPTSKERDLLTEANIHLMMAKDAMQKAQQAGIASAR